METSTSTPTHPRGLSLTANALSVVFSPLFAATISLAIALWATPLARQAMSARLTVLAMVFVITALVPLGVIIALMRSGRVSDLAISDRRQRALPFAVTTACYLAGALLLRSCSAPAWLCGYFVGAAAAAAIAIIISTRWKISAHALGMGGITGMILWLAIKGLLTLSPLPAMAVAVIASGAVAAARIFLGRHTPAQTYAGWALALAIALGVMNI